MFGKFKLLVLLFLLTTPLLSQNLVINPGFETQNCCPDAYSQFHCVKFWDTPNQGTTDFYKNCKQKYPTDVVQTPSNFFGHQVCKEGEGYAGIYTFYNDDYREYVQGELAMPLLKDQTYCLTFYVSLADTAGLAIKELGAAFHPDKIKTPFFTKLNVDYIPMTFGDSFIKDKTVWTELQTEYTANGNERFLIIGNFKDNKNTDTLAVLESVSLVDRHTSYYYLDDICLTKMTKKGDCSCEPNIDAEEEKHEEEFDQTYTDLYLFSGPPEGLVVPDIGDKVVLEHIYFETNKAILRKESLIELEALASLLNNYPDMEIEIRGHTDHVGTDENNLKLSAARAKAVFDYLVYNDIQPRRLQFIGFGETLPISTNATPEGRQKNRRVEFVVLRK